MRHLDHTQSTTCLATLTECLSHRAHLARKARMATTRTSFAMSDVDICIVLKDFTHAHAAEKLQA